MNLTTLNAADFKKIVGLLSEKETLLAQIAQINRELAAFGGAAPTKTANAKPSRKAGAKPKVKRAARGSVKAAMVELLKQAGAAGMTIKEIAAKLGASYGQVYTWFQTTGKAIKEIKKVGPGKFAWIPLAPVKPVATPQASPEKAPEPLKPSAKPARTPSAKKPGTKKPRSSKEPSLPF
jgi:transposase-like protein